MNNDSELLSQPVKGILNWAYPWGFFLFLLIVNVALSYIPLSMELKIWLFLMGIFIPMFLVMTGVKDTPRDGMAWMKDNSFEGPPWWVWILILSTSFAVRFYHLLTFIGWPLFDEMVNGYYALRLDQKWSWVSIFLL